MDKNIDIQKFMRFMLMKPYLDEVAKHAENGNHLDPMPEFEDWLKQEDLLEVYSPFKSGEVFMSEEEGDEFLDVFNKYSLPPGCHEAVNEHGCSCKVAKHNASGTSFEVSDDCPLHGKDSHLKR